MMGPLFGILAAFAWGGGDFLGGLASRRLPTFFVVLVSQASTLILIVPIAWASGQLIPDSAALTRTMIAGVSGGCGVLALYHGFAHGRISVVASIAGTLAALIPVAVTIIGGEIPSLVRLIGFITAVVAIIIVSTGEGEHPAVAGEDGAHADASSGRALGGGALYGIAAGCGFAGFSLIFSGVQADGILWLLATLRVASVGALLLIAAVALLLRKRAPGMEPIRDGAIPRDGAGRLRLAALLVATGSGDTMGNLLFFLAAGLSGVAVAAVFTSIAPITTVIFAALLLGERVARRQAFGIALAAVATVAIAVGGVA